MKIGISYLLCVCIILTACSTSVPNQGTPAYPDLIISMTRISGFGVGPQYKLDVYADGTVNFDEMGNRGKQSTTLSAEQIQKLVVAIEDANFFLLDDQYLEPAIDRPATKLTITLNGQTRSIYHFGLYNCGEYYNDAIHTLCRLEDKIDEITNSHYWVKQEW